MSRATLALSEIPWYQISAAMAAMVAAPAVDMTCSVLKSMVDLMTLPEPNTNKCSTNNLDEAACVNTFITRQDGTGDYSPCEYSLVDLNGESRYKPDDDYDTRCHSSQVRL